MFSGVRHKFLESYSFRIVFTSVRRRCSGRVYSSIRSKVHTFLYRVNTECKTFTCVRTNLVRSNCYPGSIDEGKASGKILVCVDTDPTLTRRVKKSVAEGAGAKGLILIDDDEKGVPFDSGTFPFAEVGSDVGLQILKYLNSTK